MAPPGSQKLRAQDPPPVQRYATEGTGWREGRKEGRNGDGNRGVGGNGSGNGDENGEEGGEERESVDHVSCIMYHVEVGRKARETGRLQCVIVIVSNSNHQPQPLLRDPTPQRCRRILREDQRSKIKEKSNKRDLKNGGDLGGRRKKHRQERVGSADVDGGGGRRGGEARKKNKKSNKRDLKNGGDSGGQRKKHRQERVGSVDVDPGYLENRIE